jgi:hypothetical protein
VRTEGGELGDDGVSLGQVDDVLLDPSPLVVVLGLVDVVVAVLELVDQRLRHQRVQQVARGEAQLARAHPEERLPGISCNDMKRNERKSFGKPGLDFLLAVACVEDRLGAVVDEPVDHLPLTVEQRTHFLGRLLDTLHMIRRLRVILARVRNALDKKSNELIGEHEAARTHCTEMLDREGWRARLNWRSILARLGSVPASMNSCAPAPIRASVRNV